MKKKQSITLKTISDKIVFVLSVFLMIVICITVLLQIFCRFILNNPLAWTEELSRYLFVWICMLGWVIAVKNKVHIRINFFTDLFPEKIKRILYFLNSILLIIFSIFLVYYGFILSLRVYNNSTITLYVSFFYVYLSAPVGAALIIFYTILDIIEKMKESRK